MDRYPIAATVKLDLTIQSAGAGVTGQTPVCVIQRLSDNYFYDAALPAKFAAAYATNAMVEVDEVNLAGLYRYSFNHTHDATASEYFFVRLVNTGGNDVLVDSQIAFGPMISATAATLCTLYGTVTQMGGTPAINEQVRISTLPNTFLVTGAKPAIALDNIDTYTSTTGYFSVDLIRGLVVRVQIPTIGYDKKLTIPNASSANFADL